MESFPALPGFYKIFFLYIEPFITILPTPLIWFFPGATWFFNELVVGHKAAASLDARTTMALWQLASCYGLLGLLTSLVFRAVRDALPNNPIAQERIIGATFTAMAIADVSHVLVTIVATPREVLVTPSAWNGAFIGNVHFTLLLLLGRLSWFMGIGRKSYYYSVKSHAKAS